MKIFLRSVTIILFLLLADMLFYACPKAKTYRFKYTDAEVTTYNSDTLHPKLVVEDSEVQAQTLVFGIRLSSELVAQNNLAPGLFFNSAYAFQFHDNYYNTTSLKDIKFIALNNFNVDLKKGSDITKALYFGIYEPANRLYDSSNGKTFITDYNEYAFYAESYQKTPEGQFVIQFNSLPTPNTPQQFALEIELEDGTILRDTTVRFIVK